MLGIYLSGHPLEGYAELLGKISNLKSTDLIADSEEELEGMDKSFSYGINDGMTVQIGGILTSVKKKVTKNNAMMAFGTLEDLYGTCELLIFPKIYEKFTGLLYPENLVFVKGRLSLREDDTPKILPDQIFGLPDYLQNMNAPASAETEPPKETILNVTRENAKRILAFVKFFSGRTPVKLIDQETGNCVYSGYMNASEEVMKELETLT